MKEKKILILSGDPNLLDTLRPSLSSSECQVVSAEESGEDLQRIINDTQPDLVILDIAMPKLEGIELCLRIRQWCDVPIIMLSAWGSQRGALRGLDLASDSYLTEPFDTKELKQRIQKTLCCN